MTKKSDRIKESIPPKIVKMVEELHCDLNQVEWDNRARELAESNRQVTFLEERKKSIVADLNSDIKSAILARDKLTNMVSNRRELREVIVEIKYDYDLGTVTKTRTDNNDVINTREMGDVERQGEMEFVDPNAVIESRHEDPKEI